MITQQTCPGHIFNTKTYIGELMEITMKLCVICDYVEGQTYSYPLDDMLNLNNER